MKYSISERKTAKKPPQNCGKQTLKDTKKAHGIYEKKVVAFPSAYVL